jgi:hypothetical protein
MFTEDYLMRILNQALAILMTAIGLKKSGKYSDALQAVQQAIEQVTTLPANVIDQMEDSSLLDMLVAQGQLDTSRLGILADLYQEQGEIYVLLGQPAQGSIAFARALRFVLEAALSGTVNLSDGNIGRVELLTRQLRGYSLPFDTLLALSDYYQRILEKDDQALAAAGVSQKQISETLDRLRDQLDGSKNKPGD